MGNMVRRTLMLIVILAAGWGAGAVFRDHPWMEHDLGKWQLWVGLIFVIIVLVLFIPDATPIKTTVAIVVAFSAGILAAVLFEHVFHEKVLVLVPILAALVVLWILNVPDNLDPRRWLTTTD